MRRVRDLLPLEDLVYLADQAHVPYGDRSEDDLVRLLAQNVAYLEAAGAGAVVMGCNTSCAVAARRGWPQAGIPILDLIDAAARAVTASNARRIGVIATVATARSGAYGRAIRALDPSLDVQEVAAPKLVPLVESGLLSGPIVRSAVSEALAEFARPIDALVLACTHYPLLDAEFGAILGDDVARIDPAVAQGEAAVRFASARHAVAGTGRARFVTTGPIEGYRSAIEAILGPLRPDDVVERAPISEELSRSRR